MSNKTIGGWLLGTLFAALGFYFVGSEPEIYGFIILVNWMFVIIAGIRLMENK